MKMISKLLPLFVLLALNIDHVTAQTGSAHATSGSSSTFDVGSSTMALSLGLGSNYYLDYDYYYSYSSPPSALPTFAVSFDRGIYEAGPGIIGVGSIIGLRTATHKYGSGYKATYRNIVIGARGTYHLTLLRDKNDKFDPYGGVTLGLRLYDYRDSYYEEHYGTAYAMAGLFVGAQYNFAKRVGAFAELGYDVSLLRLGINLNFY